MLLLNYRKQKGVTHIISPIKDNKGYLMIQLYQGGKRYTPRIHRLVMQSFVGDSSLVVNHKNRNRQDNRLTNLEYISQKENCSPKNSALGETTRQRMLKHWEHFRISKF